jgi:hypothetical protein
MAHISEEVLVIKITTLLPDNVDMTPIMGDENITALHQVIEQLAGDNKTLVEIERA